jgi:5'(3')-deoxyribonucleotidase
MFHDPNRVMEILLDCDGVAADFAKALCRPLTRATGKIHEPEDLTQYNYLGTLPQEARNEVIKAITEEGFCSNIEAFPDARAGIASLGEAGNITWVTSPWNTPTWVSERTRWIAEHFGKNGKNVIVTNPSALKAKVDGDMLVEDLQETLVSWLKAHPFGIGVLKTQPHNKADKLRHPRIVRASDWGLIRRLVEWTHHYGAEQAVELARDCQGVDFHVTAQS